ncbi:hypothetical protein HBB16_19680 [Pseudonocardia sp. MCCB 268]|nr:hypothetical protein [Pseudonocardia cytotoxica]
MVKPSGHPVSTLEFARLVIEPASLPAWSTSSPVTGSPAVHWPRTWRGRKVAFTGSSTNGVNVMKSAASTSPVTRWNSVASRQTWCSRTPTWPQPRTA